MTTLLHLNINKKKMFCRKSIKLVRRVALLHVLVRLLHVCLGRRQRSPHGGCPFSLLRHYFGEACEENQPHTDMSEEREECVNRLFR